MTHFWELEARRIAITLEERFPVLRADTEGKDFRPGHGGEYIVGGIMLLGLGGADLKLTDYKEDVLEFSVIYGGQQLCELGVAALRSVGIEPIVIAPHDEVLQCDGVDLPTHSGVWKVYFNLKPGWSPA